MAAAARLAAANVAIPPVTIHSTGSPSRLPPASWPAIRNGHPVVNHVAKYRAQKCRVNRSDVNAHNFEHLYEGPGDDPCESAKTSSQMHGQPGYDAGDQSQRLDDRFPGGTADARRTSSAAARGSQTAWPRSPGALTASPPHRRLPREPTRFTTTMSPRKPQVTAACRARPATWAPRSSTRRQATPPSVQAPYRSRAGSSSAASMVAPRSSTSTTSARATSCQRPRIPPASRSGRGWRRVTSRPSVCVSLAYDRPLGFEPHCRHDARPSPQTVESRRRYG